MNIEENQNLTFKKFSKKNENEPAAPISQIINIDKLAFQPEIKNSEIMLAILELCIFKDKYNIKYRSKTREFWKCVEKDYRFKKIFRNLKAGTLRNYWINIRFSENFEKFIEIVKNNKDFIDKKENKVRKLTRGISTFILCEGNDKNFEEFYSSFQLINTKFLDDKNKKGFIGKKLGRGNK